MPLGLAELARAGRRVEAQGKRQRAGTDADAGRGCPTDDEEDEEMGEADGGEGVDDSAEEEEEED